MRRWVRAGLVLPLVVGAVVGLAPGVASADSVRDAQWWLSPSAHFQLPQAWALPNGMGAGVTVGLVDSGVDSSHPDLQGGALVPGHDLSGAGSPDGLAPVSTDPEPDHGTSMAVYIAGRGHGAGGGDGLKGSAPAARVMSVSTDIGAGAGTSAQLSSAVKWAVDHGAKVINLSLGGSFDLTAAIAYAEEHDVVVVAGAGNDAGGGTNTSV